MTRTRKRIRPRTLLLLAAALTVLTTPSVATAAPRMIGQPASGSTTTSLAIPKSSDEVSATANAVVRWNATAGDAALATCLAPTNNPLHESRMYTMVHLAITMR